MNPALTFLNSILYHFSDEQADVSKICVEHDHEELKPQLISTWMPNGVGAMPGKRVIFAETQVSRKSKQKAIFSALLRPHSTVPNYTRGYPCQTTLSSTFCSNLISQWRHWQHSSVAYSASPLSMLLAWVSFPISFMVHWLCLTFARHGHYNIIQQNAAFWNFRLLYPLLLRIRVFDYILSFLRLKLLTCFP